MSTLSPEDENTHRRMQEMRTEVTVTLSAREWSNVTYALAIAADEADTHGFGSLADVLHNTWDAVCGQVDRVSVRDLDNGELAWLFYRQEQLAPDLAREVIAEYNLRVAEGR